MTGKKISRNDPCPCGSGKKFKHCCINKGIDWDARKAAPVRSVLPAVPRRRPASLADIAFLGAFGVVDSRLKEMARADQEPARWKSLVEALTDAIPEAERVAAYKAV